MLQSSTHCARKISRKQYSLVPGSGADFVGNADELLRKASRKLSQLSEYHPEQIDDNRSRLSTPDASSLNGAGSAEVSGAEDDDPIDRSSETDVLTVLDCSNLSLGQLPIEVLTEHCGEIEHLILDENELDEQALEYIPRLDKLETLSLNGNQIKDIGVFLQFLKRKCPNLKFLSLIGNPGWPHPILNNNLHLYRTYALSAVRLFPSLQFLDTARVSSTSIKQQQLRQPVGSARKRGTTTAGRAVATTGRASSAALANAAGACRLF